MGIAEIEAAGEVHLRANMIIYGAAASAEIAAMMAAEVNAVWNEAQATVWLYGSPHRLVVHTTGIYNPNLQREDVVLNKDPLNNYFRIEEYAGGNISFVDGLGCNTGYFKLENLLNKSTTVAHEFGHTLGLEHPLDLDLRGKGVPGLMYPRGTITDPQFQYDPAAAPGAVGGTMNPLHRKLLQWEVDLLALSQRAFHGPEVVGAFSNYWHEAHRP